MNVHVHTDKCVASLCVDVCEWVEEGVYGGEGSLGRLVLPPAVPASFPQSTSLPRDIIPGHQVLRERILQQALLKNSRGMVGKIPSALCSWAL